MSNNITIPSFRTINKTIQECFITNHEKRLYTWISISSILSAKNTRLAIVAIVAIVAETFNPSFVYNFRQIYQFTSHSPFPSSTPPQRSKTRNKANANDHQIVHSHQLRRLFGQNGRNGQFARGDALAMKSSELWWNSRFSFIFEAFLGTWRENVADNISGLVPPIVVFWYWNQSTAISGTIHSLRLVPTQCYDGTLISHFNASLIPLCIVTLVVGFTFLSPFILREIAMQTVIAAIVGRPHVSAKTFTHQLATHRASSASPVGVPPIAHEGLCHYVPACIFIPLIKMERSEPVQFLLTEEFLVCTAHRLSKSAENSIHCCHHDICFLVPFVD